MRHGEVLIEQGDRRNRRSRLSRAKSIIETYRGKYSLLSSKLIFYLLGCFNVNNDRFEVTSYIRGIELEERKGHFQLIGCIFSVNEAINAF
jgi:hypothetical protein